MIASYQTFPITIKTYVGTASAKAPLGERLLRANADGDVTFTFTDDSTVALTVNEGFDCVYSADVKSITSTAEITMS